MKLRAASSLHWCLIFLSPYLAVHRCLCPLRAIQPSQAWCQARFLTQILLVSAGCQLGLKSMEPERPPLKVCDNRVTHVLSKIYKSWNGCFPSNHIIWKVMADDKADKFFHFKWHCCCSSQGNSSKLPTTSSGSLPLTPRNLKIEWAEQ